MIEIKTKTFSQISDNLEITLVFITILVNFIAYHHLHSRMTSIKGELPATETSLASPLGKHNLPDLPLFKGRYFCGIRGRNALIFQFQPEGKVLAWVHPISFLNFQFPPKSRPQFKSSYHMDKGRLFWNLNIYGIPEHFSSYLHQDFKILEQQKTLMDKKGLFSENLCGNLARMLAGTQEKK